MPLAEVNTWVGVSAGLIGLAVVGQDGLLQLVAAFWQRLQGGWAWSRRHMPFLRPRRQTVNLSAAAVSAITARLTISPTSQRPWPASGTADERIDALRQQLRDVERRVETLEEVHRGHRSDVQRRFAEVDDQQRRTESKLTKRFDNYEARAATIDAWGLLPLAFGLLLAGAPHQVASCPPVAWLLIAAATISAIAVAIHEFRGWPRQLERGRTGA
jgi:hypothetical protein